MRLFSRSKHTKTRYVIEFMAPFVGRGFVHTIYYNQTTEPEFRTKQEALEKATKFRFKLWANYLCFLCINDTRSFFCSFSVKKCEINTATGEIKLINDERQGKHNN